MELNIDTEREYKLLEDKCNSSQLLSRQRVTKMDYYPNEAYYNLYGCERDFCVEKIGIKETLDRVFPSCRQNWEENINKLNTKKFKSLKFQVIIKPWGIDEYRFLAISLFAEYYKEELIKYSGISQDITDEVIEHHRLLQHIKKSDILNKKYKISLWSFEPSAKVLYSDNAVKDDVYHNYKIEDFLKKIHPNYQNKAKEIVEQMCNGTFDYKSFLLYILFPDNTYHYFQVIPEEFKDEDGHEERYLFISRDVTQEKEQEFRQNTFIEHIHYMTEDCGIRLFYYKPDSGILNLEDPFVDKKLQTITIERYLQHVHPDDRSLITNLISLCDQRQLERKEFLIRLKPYGHDTYRRYRSVALPVLDADGKLILYGFIRIDITNDYASQEMLRFSQRVGKIGAWTFDIFTGENCWSDEVFNIAGIPPSDDHRIYFNQYKDLIDKDDLDKFRKTVNGAFESGDNVVFDYYATLPSGERKHLEQRMIIEKNTDGKPVYAYGTVMDITDRSKLIKERDYASSMLTTVLKSLPTLVFIKDIDDNFKIVMANDAYAKFFDTTIDEIVGKNVSSVYNNAQAGVLTDSDKKAVNYVIDNPYTEVLSLPKSDGSVRYFKTTKFAQKNKGMNLLICVAFDVTELQKAKAKAEESDRLKSAFLANVSHEIRTPLNAIVGFSELIVSDVSVEEHEMFKDIIKANSAQLLRLINDILDLSKIEANLMNFIFTDFNLNDLLLEIYNSLRTQFEGRNLTLNYIHDSNPIPIRQDAVRINEVVSNFLTNAYKNTESGGARMWAEKLDNGRFRVYVKDTGKGIPEDKHSKIFERFEKLDSFKEGTGLGLPICKAIAEALGGTIGLESQPGCGSTFYIELPMKGD